MAPLPFIVVKSAMAIITAIHGNIPAPQGTAAKHRPGPPSRRRHPFHRLPLPIRMRIERRRHAIAVAEDFLHHRRLGAALDHHRRRRVSQPVGRGLAQLVDIDQVVLPIGRVIEMTLEQSRQRPRRERLVTALLQLLEFRKQRGQ